ncbi:hypothetical protein JCM3774_004550 [Rhodotorula dairenensis]
MELASESETLAQEDDPQTVTLSPQKIKSLANIATTQGGPPPIPDRLSRGLGEGDMSLGVCIFPKKHNFEFQMQRKFDLEKVVAGTKGIGHGRWHLKSSASTSRTAPTSAAEDVEEQGPVGRLMPESGDDGGPGGAAVIGIETTGLRVTRARLARLSAADQEAMGASMAAAVREEVRLSQLPPSRQKRKAA